MKVAPVSIATENMQAMNKWDAETAQGVCVSDCQVREPNAPPC